MDKTKLKILVPGNVNHDYPSFFGADKLDLFVRRPSQKQIPVMSGEGGKDDTVTKRDRGRDFCFPDLMW